MADCSKCGSSKAYWIIKEKDGKIQNYCDDCFKKYDLADYKKEMDEYHKNKDEGWSEVSNALQTLSSKTEPSTEMSYALCDANGIIEKCKESSLNPKTIKLNKYTTIGDYGDLIQILSIKDPDPDKNTIVAKCYGQGKYRWYICTLYSEKKLRDVLQALPVLTTLSIPTYFWKVRLEKVKSDTLDDILDICKSVTNKFSDEALGFSSAGYVCFSSSVDAGEYEQVYTYEIRKKSQDTFEWVNNLGTRTK